jgi:hypothetical protein
VGFHLPPNIEIGTCIYVYTASSGGGTEGGEQCACSEAPEGWGGAAWDIATSEGYSGTLG